MRDKPSMTVDVQRIGTARRLEYGKRNTKGRFVHDFGRNVPVYRTACGRFIIIGGKLKVSSTEIRG